MERLEKAIREYCKKNNMGVCEFAEKKLKVSRSYLYAVFKNKRIGLQTAKKYAKIINRDFAELFL